ATAMEQNASLISQLAMSPMASRARSSAFGIASVGASPVRSGGTPTDAQARIRAKEVVAMSIAGHIDPSIFKRYNNRRDDLQVAAAAQRDPYLATRRHD